MEQVLLDRLWIIICSVLVFLMQAGFLCLEAGATRQKNSVNVALKNLTDFAVSILLFWLIGYTIMFGVTENGWWTGVSQWSAGFTANFGTDETVFFLFQAMFCGTAVTIVSGAVAERMHFQAYVVLSALISGLIYPIFGHWSWNGLMAGDSNGWLGTLGFVDFAGSTVVHGLGGGVALAALLVIGARHDRFTSHGTQHNFYGSDSPRAILGALILWFGWLGFNGGSTLAFDDRVAVIILNTVLGGAGGLLFPLAIALGRGKQVQLEWITNGCLAGLVSVTACCHVITPTAAIIVGAIGGVVMSVSDRLLLRYRIDDAVGAVPVHLGGGIWGTLSVALFGDPEMIGTGLSPIAQLGIQALGAGGCLLWAGGTTLVILKVMRRFILLRVSAQEELLGLNIVEQGARSELVDMFEVMSEHQKTGDLKRRVPATPFTEVGQIALRYNQVIESLEQATARTNAIVNTAPDAILTVSPLDRTILTVNTIALKMFQCEESELLGKPVTDLFCLATFEPDFNPAAGALTQPIQEGDRVPLFWENLIYWVKEGTIVELVGRCPDGWTFPIELRAAPCHEGPHTTFIVLLSDISLRKLNEQALQKAAKDLRARNQQLTEALENLRRSQAQIQTEKISALGRMVAGIAHEINNPIGFIQGNLSYLGSYMDDVLGLVDLYQEHLPTPPVTIGNALEDLDLEFLRKDLPAVLQSMRHGVERIGTIVKSLRTFSRLDESSLKTVDLHESLDSTLLLLEYSLKNNDIQLVREYGSLPPVECFIGNLNQVFFNILSNAVEALSEMRGVRSPLQLTVTTDYEDGASVVFIHIQDNGGGIDPDTLSQIFDPFYTTKPIGEGTGLGLAVSYQIVVDEHQGKLTVDSEPGESTTFTIQIPRCQTTLSPQSQNTNYR